MAYIVVKTIKGRQYRYLQRSWREGGKVRTESKCLGPLSPLRLVRKAAAFIKAQGPLVNSLPDMETEFLKHQEREQLQDAIFQARLQDLHDRYGLRMAPASPPVATAVQENTPSVEGAENVSTPTPTSM